MAATSAGEVTTAPSKEGDVQVLQLREGREHPQCCTAVACVKEWKADGIGQTRSFKAPWCAGAAWVVGLGHSSNRRLVGAANTGGNACENFSSNRQ